MKLSNKAAEALGNIRRSRKPRIVTPEGGWKCGACDARNFTPQDHRCGNPTCPTRTHG